MWSCSKSSAGMPRASLLTRALMSFEMKTVRLPLAWRSCATPRMRLSALSRSSAKSRFGAAGDADRAALLVPHHALEQRALRPETVERARDGAGVAARFVVVLLEGVELLDHREGNDHLVLGELEDRLRVVEEHVRVEDEVLAAGRAFTHRCVAGDGLSVG